MVGEHFFLLVNEEVIVFLGVLSRGGGLSFILFGGGSIGISQWVVKDFAS